MRFTLFSFVVAALSVQQAVSIPFDKRNASNDTKILQFALTLEHIEVAFYAYGLELFRESDFMAEGFTPLTFKRFVEISQHENKHAELLTTALGDQATQACNYSFPINDVRTFARMSQVFEDVGTSAYTGAIKSLTSPQNTLASASILATEARQATWVSVSVNKGVPWGSDFETPLTMRQAFTVASGSIVSCPPTNPNLDLTPFPSLNINGAFPGKSVFPGDNATVQYAPSSNVAATHVVFLSGLSLNFVVIKDGIVAVPRNLSGQVYAIATSSGTELSDNTTIAGPAVMLFERFSNGTLTN